MGATPQPVIFPDAELETVLFLRTSLAIRPEPYAAGVTIGTREQESRPLVVVRRSGGRSSRMFDRPRIDLRTFGDGSVDGDALAGDVARLCHALLLSWRGHVPADADVLAPIPITDPDTGATERLSTVGLIFRGVAAP